MYVVVVVVGGGGVVLILNLLFQVMEAPVHKLVFKQGYVSYIPGSSNRTI